MSGWPGDELPRVGDATELQLAPGRRDGALRTCTTMWVVRVGDDLYLRSAGGPDRPWYRHAVATGTGRIRTGGVEADVHSADADPGSNDAIVDAYHAKCDRYGPGPVGHVTGSSARARAVTIRLVRSEP